MTNENQRSVMLTMSSVERLIMIFAVSAGLVIYATDIYMLKSKVAKAERAQAMSFSIINMQISELRDIMKDVQANMN